MGDWKCSGLKIRLVALLVLGATGMSACVIAEPGPPPPGPPPGRPHASPKIPPGHLPPPGACRVWFPNRPPGHQPPPGPCEELQYRVPPGAYLIRG
jgi:hypothetical protein